jgi:hypothetical protein
MTRPHGVPLAGRHARDVPLYDGFDRVATWWRWSAIATTCVAVAAYLVSAHSEHRWLTNGLAPLSGTLVSAVAFAAMAFIANASRGMPGRPITNNPGGWVNRRTRWLLLALASVCLLASCAVSVGIVFLTLD